jgi:hypothetical protein
VNRIFIKFIENGRDLLINEILKQFNVTNGVMLYNILSANTIDVIVSILSLKLGLSKIAILIIIGFLA